MRVAVSCYLLKVEVKVVDAVADSARDAVEWLRPVSRKKMEPSGAEFPLEDSTDRYLDIRIAVRRQTTSVPAWRTFLESAGVPDIDLTTSESFGCVLFVQTNTKPRRVVAWTFGSGWQMLDRRCLEDRFGLLSALNRIERSLGGDSGVTRARVSARSGAVRAVGVETASPVAASEMSRIDTMSDLLLAITGSPGDDGNGAIHGGRGLRSTDTLAGVESLVTLSDVAVADSLGAEYHARYDWIDRHVPETDPVVLDEIRALVWAADGKNGTPQVELLTPGSDEGLVGHQFLLQGERGGAHAPGRRNLNWSIVKAKLAAAGVVALNSDIRSADENGDEISRTKVFDLLTAEFDLKGTHYVLSDGTAYRVDPKFIASLNADLAQYLAPSGEFPNYETGDSDEAAYNTRVAKELVSAARPVVLLDKALIRSAGELSGIEPCDLLVDHTRFMHVKRESGSSCLNHLWAQGVSSLRLLRRSAPAREALLQLVRDSAIKYEDDNTIAKLPDLMSSVSDFSVEYVILSSTHRAGIGSLPLMARINLKAEVEVLRDLGVQPRIHLASAPPKAAPKRSAGKAAPRARPKQGAGKRSPGH